MKPSPALRINPGGPHSTHHRMNVKGFASRAGGSCSKEASRHLSVAAAAPTLDIHPVARRLAANRVNATVQLCTSMAKRLHPTPNRVAQPGNQLHITAPVRLDFFVRQRLLFCLTEKSNRGKDLCAHYLYRCGGKTERNLAARREQNRGKGHRQRARTPAQDSRF